MGYFGKRFAYDLAKAHARDKQAKKRAKQQAKINKEKAKEKARVQAEKERERAIKENIKAQEKAEKERIKAEERAEKERQEAKKAMLKLDSLEIKFNMDIQQLQDMVEYIQGKEEFMMKYSDIEWLVEQVKTKGADRTIKPLQTLVNKCDALIKKLDTVNNELIQLMTFRDKYATDVPMELDEWRELYKNVAVFSNEVKSGLITIIGCVEQIEEQLLFEN